MQRKLFSDERFCLALIDRLKTEMAYWTVLPVSQNYILRLNNCCCIAELMQAVTEAYSPSPCLEFVDLMYDVRTWMAATEAELHNITNPHCFVLKESSSGDVVLKYKNWSRDKHWKPSNATDEGVVVLEVSRLLLMVTRMS